MELKPYCLINLSRCEGSARIFGVGISAFDPSLPGITNRTEDCTLETIGKPVFKRYIFSTSLNIFGGLSIVHYFLFVSIYCWTSLEKSPVQLAKSFIVSSTQFILNILSAVGDTLSVSFNRMNFRRGDGEKVFYCIEILTLKDMDETRRKPTYSASPPNILFSQII